MSRRRKQRQQDPPPEVPDEPEGDERQRQFDTAVRVGLAAADRALRHSSSDPPDVGAMVDEALARREADAAAAAERAEVERLACPDGRGCARCGVSHCGRRVWAPGAAGGYRVEVEPGWDPDDAGGWRCSGCSAAYWRMVGQSDLDRRIEAIYDRLGGPVPFACEAHPDKLQHVAAWFHEFPGAEPSMVPWAFLDPDALRAAVDAALHPPPAVPDGRSLRRGDRCEVCGTRTKLVEERQTALPGRSGTYMGVVEDEHCRECLRRWYAADGADVSGPLWTDSGAEAVRR